MEIFLQATINGLVAAGLYALIAYGLVIVLSIMNVVNFAHGEFVMLGAYLAYWGAISTGIDPLLLALPVALVMFLGGMLLYRALLRPVLGAAPINQLALTFGLSLVLQNLALVLWHSDLRSVSVPYGAVSIHFAGIYVGLVRALALVVACASIFALGMVQHHTRLGKGMQAVSQNKVASALIGINVNQIQMLTFAAAAAAAGAAGAVVSVLMYTYPTVGVHLVLKAFAVVVLGGLGSITGVIVASILLGVSESYVGTFIPNGSGWAEGVSFLLIIVALIAKPQGLFGIRDHD